MMMLKLMDRPFDIIRKYPYSLNNSCFGVCLINNPEDSNRPANHMKVGTMAEICDFSTLDDGLLGITAYGRKRFIILETRMRDNGLLIGEVETLDEPGPVEIVHRRR